MGAGWDKAATEKVPEDKNLRAQKLNSTGGNTLACLFQFHFGTTVIRRLDRPVFTLHSKSPSFLDRKRRVWRSLMLCRSSIARLQLRPRCCLVSSRSFQLTRLKRQDGNGAQAWEPFWLKAIPQSTKEDSKTKLTIYSAGPEKEKGALPRRASGEARKARAWEPTFKVVGSGVRVTIKGLLVVDDRNLAIQPEETALIVSSLGSGLWAKDFYRLAKEELPAESFKGGLKKAIVARDEKLNPLSSWLLLFETPYHASTYQNRLHWYVNNTKTNLPVSPIQYWIGPNRPIVPHETYKDPKTGQSVWQGLRDFALYTNTQELNLTPLLPPLEGMVAQCFKDHEAWTTNAEGVRCWPVRLHLMGQIGGVEGRGELLDYIPDLVESSGGMRLVGEPQQLHYDCKSPGVESSDSSPARSWVIKFETERDALHFWMDWQHRPLPGHSASGGSCAIHVELMW